MTASATERRTIPAPASRDEAELATKLELDRARRRRAAAAEPTIRAWMAAQIAGRDS